MLLVVAFAFELINGFHDTANSIATTVYTRALSPGVAIAMSAVMNFVGALTNESVARTISSGLVDVQLELYVILAALLGAIFWNLLTWWLTVPSSSSHALIGSLIGATIAYTHGFSDVRWEGVVEKVVIPLFTSPLIGFVLGFAFMRLVFELFANWTPANANGLFHRLQIASSAFMAYSHGSNDAQKTMGIITLALTTEGLLSQDGGVPLWVKLFCAATMALGTAIGGQRIMKTLGRGVFRLEPSIGFVANMATAIAIEDHDRLGRSRLDHAGGHHLNHGRRQRQAPRRRAVGYGAQDCDLMVCHPAGHHVPWGGVLRAHRPVRVTVACRETGF